MKPIIIIPAYNESSHIAHVVKESLPFANEVVVVDDGSSDKTEQIATTAGATVLHHLVNLGKGAALKTGCDYAVQKGEKIIVVLDADGQHDPNHIPQFLEKLSQGDEVVLGYRAFSKKMPFILKIGNTFINFMTTILYGMHLRDTQSGYRAFTTSAYNKIRWEANDYSMESEMIANIGKHKLKYNEIPISTIYTNRYKGTTIVDGIKITLNLLKWRIRP